MPEKQKNDCSIDMEYDTSGSGNGKTTATCKEDADGSQVAQGGTKESKKGGIKWKLLVVTMVIESIIFVCAMSLLIASLRVDSLNNSMLWDLGIWKWCLLTISILCGRLIAYLLTKALLFLLWIFWLNRRVLYFAYGVRKSFMFMIWVGLVTLAWSLLTTLSPKRSEDVSKIFHDVTRGLIGCLIGAILWLIKTLIVKLVGSFHAKKLFEKIEEAIRLRKTLLALSIWNLETDKTSNSEKQTEESVSGFIGNCKTLLNKRDIEDLDSEKQEVNEILIWHERACKALSMVKIEKTKDSFSVKTMIELINAIRGKKLPPLAYIPRDTNTNTSNNNNNVAEATKQKVASQQKISKGEEEARKKLVAAMENTKKITEDTEARTVANLIFAAIAGSKETELSKKTK